MTTAHQSRFVRSAAKKKNTKNNKKKPGKKEKSVDEKEGEI